MTDNSNQNLEAILEGAIIASMEPLTLSKLASLFSEEERPSAETISTALRAIQNNCEGRGFSLVEVASGWRFQVREEFATWVNRLWEEKPQKYSRALLETLALIAYRQPITRGDIEEVRGVAVSSHIIKTLMERDWVKVIGHRDVPGRPALYATTRLFLDYFNLKSLDELPTLGELKDIDALDGNLDLGEPLAAMRKTDPSEEAGGLALEDVAEEAENVEEGVLASGETETEEGTTQVPLEVEESVEESDAEGDEESLYQEGENEALDHSKLDGENNSADAEDANTDKQEN